MSTPSPITTHIQLQKQITGIVWETVRRSLDRSAAWTLPCFSLSVSRHGPFVCFQLTVSHCGSSDSPGSTHQQSPNSVCLSRWARWPDAHRVGHLTLTCARRGTKRWSVWSLVFLLHSSMPADVMWCAPVDRTTSKKSTLSPSGCYCPPVVMCSITAKRPQCLQMGTRGTWRSVCNRLHIILPVFLPRCWIKTISIADGELSIYCAGSQTRDAFSLEWYVCKHPHKLCCFNHRVYRVKCTWS